MFYLYIIQKKYIENVVFKLLWNSHTQHHCVRKREKFLKNFIIEKCHQKLSLYTMCVHSLHYITLRRLQATIGLLIRGVNYVSVNNIMET